MKDPIKNNMVLIDYGMGNLRSVEKAFEQCGKKPKITHSARDIERADKLILPGVGAFDHAMHELKKRKLVEPLQEKIKSGAPYLGLCLGLQLLFSKSEEGGWVSGLNVVPGAVRKFSDAGRSRRLKIPHMGWNTLKITKKNSPLFKDVAKGDYFYFVHSYFGLPEDRAWTSAVTRYGVEFCSSLWKDNIFATQFHPEKSQKAGLRIIKNFIEL